MKQLQIAILALGSAGMMGVSPAQPIQPWLGTWSCHVAGANHTATFTSVLGGNAMHIAETSSPASEETILFDAKRQKWVDEYADASGAYFMLEGPQNGKTIRFAQVYPAGDTVVLVTLQSKNTYTTTYSATMNGKKISVPETCTRK